MTKEERDSLVAGDILSCTKWTNHFSARYHYTVTKDLTTGLLAIYCDEGQLHLIHTLPLGMFEVHMKKEGKQWRQYKRY